MSDAGHAVQSGMLSGANVPERTETSLDRVEKQIQAIFSRTVNTADSLDRSVSRILGPYPISGDDAKQTTGPGSLERIQTALLSLGAEIERIEASAAALDTV